MRKAFGVLVLLSGLAFAGLGLRVAIRGAAPPLPSGEGVVEGVVLPGATLPSPVGAPILYGRLTIAHAASEGRRGSLARVERDFGDPRVRVRTDAGERTLELPRPDSWRIYAGGEAEGTVMIRSLDAVPLLGAEDARQIGRTLEPPYEVTMRAVRPGDPLIAAARGEHAESVYLGERAELEAQRTREESMRWPAVLLLLGVGAGSVALAVFLFRKPREDEDEGEA